MSENLREKKNYRKNRNYRLEKNQKTWKIKDKANCAGLIWFVNRCYEFPTNYWWNIKLLLSSYYFRSPNKLRIRRKNQWAITHTSWISQNLPNKNYGNCRRPDTSPSTINPNNYQQLVRSPLGQADVNQPSVGAPNILLDPRKPTNLPTFDGCSNILLYALSLSTVYAYTLSLEWSPSCWKYDSYQTCPFWVTFSGSHAYLFNLQCIIFTDNCFLDSFTSMVFTE